MSWNDPRFSRRSVGFGGSGGPPPRDLIVLLAVLLLTYSLRAFTVTSLLPRLLELSRNVWRGGFLWQLGTYVFVAAPTGGLFFLIGLLILFWFGRDVYRYLGRKGFWRLLAWAGFGASISAAIVQLLLDTLWPGAAVPVPFQLMQGQHILMTILIAAFATVYANATILLFFVLPIQARWFIWLEILFAFMGFLNTKDFAGFIGVCVAVGITWSLLTGRGPRQLMREGRLRIERKLIERKLKRRKDRRGFRVLPGGDDDGRVHRGPWVN